MKMLHFQHVGFLHFLFFNWDSLHARLNSHYEALSYKKRSTKKVTGYIKIWKAFYRQRIPDFSHARKETVVDIDILVTSRNGDRKIRMSGEFDSRKDSQSTKFE